ncbi:MAG: hypothetical protein HQM00_11820, partial [Magnetococcales bacterium]|nr:hypothetical protein [Magnetococcales bacterium]
MSEKMVQRFLMAFLVVVLALLGVRLGKSMFTPLPSSVSGPAPTRTITWRLGVG